MSTILLTGATGAVGQALVPSLKRRGHRLIYIARGDNPAERLQQNPKSSHDVFWKGDIIRPFAGVEPTLITRWQGKVDHLIHLAGSIKFDDHLAADIRSANIDGTQNILTLATALAIPRVHYMSTAYVAGDAEKLTEDDINCGQSHRNEYERSKSEAERLVRQWTGQSTIYRMSIMVGDSQTGHITAFNGYYGFFISFWRLLSVLRHRWKKDQERVRQDGIEFDLAGRLILPIVMPCSTTSTLNLIPADWLAETMAKLVVKAGDKKTFHLVHPDPPRVQWIIEHSLAHMGISGLRYGLDEKLDSAKSSYLAQCQTSLNRELARYRPYITHDARLSNDQLVQCLGDQYQPPPAIDGPLLERLLNYAIQHNFGRASTKAA